jgi:hydrogenase nickel incorporation protein HypA/HybF
MHELSIAENIIDIIKNELPKHKLTKVTHIKLRIGAMRQIVPESLQFGFEFLSKNTPLEGAQIHIENTVITAHCRQCSSDFVIQNWLESCPVCQKNDFELISGKELEVVEFEGS